MATGGGEPKGEQKWQQTGFGAYGVLVSAVVLNSTLDPNRVGVSDFVLGLGTVSCSSRQCGLNSRSRPVATVL